jgi:hypothetical protein
MDKIWFILIEDKQEGPYSIEDLKKDHRLTPDTLVWREGMASWTAIRKIYELREIFEDKKPSQSDEEEKSKKDKLFSAGKDELAIDLRKDYPPIFWILIGLIVLSYFLYRFFGQA